MSSEDGERGEKDNAAPILKPESAQNKDRAPVGSVGTQRLGVPSLEPGSSSRSWAKDFSYQRAEEKEQQKDSRPISPITGDSEVDREYSKDNRLVSQEEYDRLTGGKEQDQAPSLDDYRRSDNGNQHDREDTGQSENLLDQYRRGRDDDRQGRSR